MKKENIKKSLIKLEKRRVISRKPKPIIPFILSGIIYSIFIISRIIIEIPNALVTLIFVLSVLTFIFAVIHFIIAKILKS